MAKTKYKEYSPFERLQLLELYDESDLSQDKFCELHQVNKWTLTQWIRDRKNNTGVFKDRDKSLPEGAKPENPVFFRQPSVEDGSLPAFVVEQKREKNEQQHKAVPPSGSILLRRGGWEIEVTAGCDMAGLKALLSMLTDLLPG